ncbi:MAG: hypothetical protein M3460_20050 [Actinomycetota bacterium]|nr:hypothetical protein [Actinomycetota bacterium]
MFRWWIGRRTDPDPAERSYGAGEAGIRELSATFGSIKQQWTVKDVIATADKVAVRATNTVE